MTSAIIAFVAAAGALVSYMTFAYPNDKGRAIRARRASSRQTIQRGWPIWLFFGSLGFAVGVTIGMKEDALVPALVLAAVSLIASLIGSVVYGRSLQKEDQTASD